MEIPQQPADNKHSNKRDNRSIIRTNSSTPRNCFFLCTRNARTRRKRRILRSTCNTSIRHGGTLCCNIPQRSNDLPSTRNNNLSSTNGIRLHNRNSNTLQSSKRILRTRLRRSINRILDNSNTTRISGCRHQPSGMNSSSPA